VTVSASGRDTAQGPSAVVLLSGGLDSTTVLAIAQQRGYACHALAFRYGQRHSVELDHARAIAARAASFRVVDIDLAAFGGSSLTTDAAHATIEKGRDVQQMAQAVPSTYVPARNTIFLSFALALCEVTGARRVFIGANAVDYSGYPDCRPDYLRAFETMANLGTRLGTEATSDDDKLRIEAPLLSMTKADIITAGTALGVDYAATWSCYDPQPRTDGSGVGACGGCDSCRLRQKGFADAGVTDPTRYA
jgi:7-cyano-7-deazaguanine synthase